MLKSWITFAVGLSFGNLCSVVELLQNFFTETITPLAGSVQIWDMPGDTLYSALASLLMVRHAIYIVTFDLSLDPQMPSPADVSYGDGRPSRTYLESIVDSLDFIRACTSVSYHDSGGLCLIVYSFLFFYTRCFDTFCFSMKV